MTLGERLEDINAKIDKAENAQLYQVDGKQVSRGLLFRMYEERDRILEKISSFGRNYTEGADTLPTPDTSLVSFI
jgi:hypothetical protein